MILKHEADLLVAKIGQLRLVEFERMVPPQLHVPDVGRSSVPIIYSSVLLPDPLGPRIARFCPPIIPATHRAAPQRFSARVGNSLVIFSTSKSGMRRACVSGVAANRQCATARGLSRLTRFPLMVRTTYVHPTREVDPMPDEQPQVILSAFADEAANQKTAVQQFAALAAVGLQYYSIRFIDVGGGIKNVMKLTRAEITKIRHLEDEYGLNVTSIGSPLGKVKLVDKDDGTKNAYVPFKKYLAGDVKHACELAHAFETKLIRGFSFYPPRGADPHEHLPQVVDQLGQIAEACHRSDLTYGLEIEANLVGQTGQIMAEIYRQVNHPALLLIFDAGNIISSRLFAGRSFPAIPGHEAGHRLDTHQRLSPAASRPSGRRTSTKMRSSTLCPPNWAIAPTRSFCAIFAKQIPALEKKLRRRGIPGVFLDLEPHLKGGGQFGGFSGPDGMGVATRSLCRVLDLAGIGYHLRDFDDVLAARGNC